MMTRSRFYRLALDANERRANVREVDVLPIPTLDERATLYLRAVHGNRDFTEEERSNARNVLLNSMAAEIAAQVIPVEQSPLGEHGADRGSLLAQYAAHYWKSVQRKEAISVAPIARRRTSILALTATFGLVLIVTGGTLGYRWTPPTQEVRETPPTTSPSTQEVREVPPTTSPPTEEAREAPPTTSPMPVVPRVTTLRVRPVILPESVPQQSTSVTRGMSRWATAAPQSISVTRGLSQLATAAPWLGRGQAESRAILALPTVEIASQRSLPDVLAVFRKLQEEQPTLFGQATLKRIILLGNLGLQDSGFSKAVPVAASVSPPSPQVPLPDFTAQVGPFASAKDAVAACQVLQAAADIRCLGFSGLK